MKIEGTRPTSTVTSGRRASATDASGFSVPTGEARAVSGAQPAAPLAALDGLIALQVDGGGKRRRQVRRGAEALDALDRLAASLLGGADGAGGDLAALRGSLAGREETGDPGLDSVLREIDVRSAVELAKRERDARKP
jgi:hypothetical protein